MLGSRIKMSNRELKKETARGRERDFKKKKVILCTCTHSQNDYKLYVLSIGSNKKKLSTPL